jgi:hypothetical protein
VTNTEFRPGDVLTISCPFTEVTVVDVTRFHVAVSWPWWRPDPHAEGTEWNGNYAIARGPDPSEIFRTEPPADTLQPGTRCRIGIPTTVVHVIDAQTFDPPLETGWLPRPVREIVVLPQGISEDPNAIEQGTGINPDDNIPMAIDIIFRPYAFLEYGDDVTDDSGRVWRFDGPWNWHPYDGHAGIPTWPLTLLAAGDGTTDAERKTRIAKATRTGSHQAEVDRWQQATNARPLIRPVATESR